jgi:hypothetical protein
MIWWLLAIEILFFWFIQNCIHDLAHLAAGAYYEGRMPKVFKPWPHVYRGRFHFARYHAGPARYKTDKPWMFNIMPFWFGLLWASVWWFGFCVAIYKSCAWAFYLLPPVACGLVDALFFWWTYLFGSAESDGKKYRRHCEQ